MCTYLIMLWGPSGVESPVTYNILANVSNPLASEISCAGNSIINPVIIINYIAFIFFWGFIFIKFRNSMYFESQIYLIFLAIVILSVMVSSLSFCYFTNLVLYFIV